MDADDEKSSKNANEGSQMSAAQFGQARSGLQSSIPNVKKSAAGVNKRTNKTTTRKE